MPRNPVDSLRNLTASISKVYKPKTDKVVEPKVVKDVELSMLDKITKAVEKV